MSPSEKPVSLLDRAWRLLFALLCLVLAARDLLGPKVDPTVIGLIALATAPWSLPWVAERVQSLKVGGMELNFRQQIEKVEAQVAALDNQGKEVAAKVGDHQKAVAAALSSGIGRPRQVPSDGLEMSEGRSFSVPAAPDPAKPASPAAASSLPDPADPNKNQFGGKAVASGRKLSAVVKAFPGSADLFVISASVVSIDPTKPLIDNTPVTFHLHGFDRNENTTQVKNGAATLDCVSSGAFTIGAEVDPKVEDVRLELDLRDVSDAPVEFKSPPRPIFRER